MLNISGTGAKLSSQDLAGRRFPIQFICEWANSVIDKETGELLEYRHLMKRPKYKKPWEHSFGNVVGRLCQGIDGRAVGTDTMFFIHKSEVPADRFKDVTYGKINCDFKATKEEKNRTRLTVGGDRINYPGDCGTPTADLLTVKLLLNSVVSTAGAEFMTLDIKNFYLCTPLERYEYLRMSSIYTSYKKKPQ